MADTTDCRSSQVAVTLSAPVPSQPTSNSVEGGPAYVGVVQRGLPRPSDVAGTPIPYITSFTHDGTPDWRHVDPQLALECQATWLCQVCGLELPQRAWVVVDRAGEVVSGTALHHECVSMAAARCPHLRAATELETLEVDRGQILADDVPLPEFPTVEHCDDFGPYGNRLRYWRVAGHHPDGTCPSGRSVVDVSASKSVEVEREDGRVPGLPRPRSDGMPVPWTTFMLDVEDVWWRAMDMPRLLRCQAEWLCQVCGLDLASTAWVVVGPEGEILSDAALHGDCLTIARRWCPELKHSTYEAIEVDRHRILADGLPLDSFPAGHGGAFGAYGDIVRGWTLAPTDR